MIDQRISHYRIFQKTGEAVAISGLEEGLPESSQNLEMVPCRRSRGQVRRLRGIGTRSSCSAKMADREVRLPLWVLALTQSCSNRRCEQQHFESPITNFESRISQSPAPRTENPEERAERA